MPLITRKRTVNYAFQATMDDTAHFYNLLRSLVFRETGVIFVYTHGIKIVVEDYKAIQGNLYMKKDFFSSYHVTPPEGEAHIKLRLNISHLVECLGLFSSKATQNVPLKLAYFGYGYPLKVVMGDAHYATACKIKTLDCETEDVMDFGFETESIISKAIFQTGILREVFSDMDPEASHMFISLSPDGPPDDFFTKEVMDPKSRDDLVTTGFALLRTQATQPETQDGQEAGPSQESAQSHLDDYAPPNHEDGFSSRGGRNCGFIRFAVKNLDIFSACYDFNEHHGAIDRFFCNKRVRNKYEMELLKRMAKTMGIAEKVSIRTDERGVLSFQYLIPINTTDHCFIEFYCMPEHDGSIPEEEIDSEQEETTMH